MICIKHFLIFPIIFIICVNTEKPRSDNNEQDKINEYNDKGYGNQNIPSGFAQVKNALDFRGKVALVTGSNSGIGAETVRLFSYLGAQVVVTGRNTTRIRQVAQQCCQLSPNGLRPLEVTADLTVSEDVRRLVYQTVNSFGKIDILVNNAGIDITVQLLNRNYSQVYYEVTDINERAVLQVTQLAIPYLNQTNGTVIMMSSETSERSINGSSSYAMSKAALVTLTRTLSVELGPRIRVNSISPGVITNTRLFPPLQTSYIEYVTSATPVGRMGLPLDVAKGVVFMASPLAEWVDAENLFMNGGFHGDYNFGL